LKFRLRREKEGDVWQRIAWDHAPLDFIEILPEYFDTLSQSSTYCGIAREICRAFAYCS